MKRNLVCGLAALCLTGSMAFAGGIAPAVTPEVVVADTGSSADQSIIVPLMALLFVVAVITNGD